MKLPAKIQLAGKPVVVRRSRRPLKGEWGYYRNDKKSGEIVLSKDLPDSRALTILIHEALHGLFFYLDEEVVHQASIELAEALETLELA